MKTGTIARLFGNAGNRCSWCRDELEIAKVRIGEMAHIIAQSPQGPRGEIGYEGDIDDYENLILLCKNHHGTIDGDAIQFPIEFVRELKASHEAWVRSCLADVSQRYIDVHGLQALLRFLPLTQLNGAFHMLPGSMHPTLLQTLSALETFPIDNPQCRPFIDPRLERCYLEFESRFSALIAALAGPDFGQAYYEPTALGGSLILSRHLDPSTAAEVKRNVQAAVDAVYLISLYTSLMPLPTWRRISLTFNELPHPLVNSGEIAFTLSLWTTKWPRQRSGGPIMSLLALTLAMPVSTRGQRYSWNDLRQTRKRVFRWHVTAGAKRLRRIAF